LPREAVTDQPLVADLPLLRFLPDEVRSQVVSRFVPVTYPFGGVLATQGEPADALYVVVSGRARVIKRLDHDEEAPLNVLRPGDSFGETELFTGRMHPTTVRAMSDVLALRLDKTAFNELLQADPDVGTYLELQLKHGTLRGFFRDFPAFASIPSEAMVGIVLAELEPRTVAAGEVIFAQGEAAGPLFLIEEGRARILRRDHDGLQFVGAVGAGQYVGEESALTGKPRTITVEAITACRLLALSPDTVSRLAAALPEFRQRLEQRIAQYAYRTRAHVPEGIDRELLPAAAGQQQADDSQVDQGEADTTTAEAPFEDGGHFVKRRRRVRRMRFIHQVDEMDCGAASLAMVTHHFGRRVSLARIRQLVNTGLDGTSLRSLCSAAEELGLAARSVKASLTNLDRMPLPAICHWDSDHWLVLYHVTRHAAFVADPAYGFRKLPREEFERRWTGYAALFDYTPAFEQAPVTAGGLRWLGPIVRPHLDLVVKALGLALVVSVLEMVLPVFTQVIVDRVLVEQDSHFCGSWSSPSPAPWCSSWPRCSRSGIS
jgi:ATP-binding cassette subfamily B protein